MSVLHIHAPKGESFSVVNHCPTCDRMRRMAGVAYEWYGTTLTCAGCGEEWQDGERAERPFFPGWRRRNIAEAIKRLAVLGVQA